MYIDDFDYAIKKLGYELLEEGDSFTLRLNFSFTNKSLSGAYLAIAGGLFFWVMTFSYAEGNNLWLGFVVGLVAIALGIMIIWMEKNQYLTIGPDVVKFREVFRKNEVRLKPGLEVDVDTETNRFTKRGVTSTHINTFVVLGKVEEKQVVFSLESDVSEAFHVEELTRGLKKIIEQRIKGLEPSEPD